MWSDQVALGFIQQRLEILVPHPSIWPCCLATLVGKALLELMVNTLTGNSLLLLNQQLLVVLHLILQVIESCMICS